MRFDGEKTEHSTSDRNNAEDTDNNNFEDNANVNTEYNNSFGIVEERGTNIKLYADSTDAISNTGEITEVNATKAVETKSETGILCYVLQNIRATE